MTVKIGFFKLRGNEITIDLTKTWQMAKVILQFQDQKKFPILSIDYLKSFDSF